MSGKNDFNNSSVWRISGAVSGTVLSLGIAALSLAKMADGNIWVVGVVLGSLGTIGGAFDTYRCIAAMNKPNNNEPPEPKP